MRLDKRYLKFVRYENVGDHERLGWIGLKPKFVMHHHAYGAEMAWVCDCPLPESTTHQPETEQAGT